MLFRQSTSLEKLKIYGSRMTGALFTPKQAFAVFNAMDSIPTFDPQIERRAKVMLQRVCFGVNNAPVIREP